MLPASLLRHRSSLNSVKVLPWYSLPLSSTTASTQLSSPASPSLSFCFPQPQPGLSKPLFTIVPASAWPRANRASPSHSHLHARDPSFSPLNFEISVGVIHPCGTQFLESVNIFLPDTFPEVCVVWSPPCWRRLRLPWQYKQLCLPASLLCFIMVLFI